MFLPNGSFLYQRYQITRPLGQGGMGSVYLAQDRRFSQRWVAVKENLETTPAARQQFQLEADMLAQLRHPGLPAVTDHFLEANGRQYLVMDFIAGEDLDTLVQRQGPMPEATALKWFDQVLAAVEYLHNQPTPIIHRDIKPANIRLTPQGQTVLVDFGIARSWQAGQKTMTGARAASPGFSPVEQYTGGTDIRSDVYSLGATLYFMLTGHIPPEAPSLASGQTLPHPRQLNPAISARVEQVILRAMALHVERRYQTVADMRQDLQQDINNDRSRLTRLLPPNGWSMLTIGIVLIATLILVVGIGRLRMQSSNREPEIVSALTMTVPPSLMTPLPSLISTVSEIVTVTTLTVTPSFTATPLTATAVTQPDTIATVTPFPSTTRTPTTTASPEVVQLRIMTDTNVRNGPGVVYPIIDLLRAGTIVPVLARTQDGNWYNVLLNESRRGWVWIDNVELTNNTNADSIPVAATIPAPPTATATLTPRPTHTPIPTLPPATEPPATEPPPPPTQPPPTEPPPTEPPPATDVPPTPEG